MHVLNCYGIIGWLFCAGCGVQHHEYQCGIQQLGNTSGHIVAVRHLILKEKYMMKKYLQKKKKYFNWISMFCSVLSFYFILF